MFEQVKIILINTTHPGNVGAVARAMKNMGFKHLYLVSPQCFPSAEAVARASGAEDILAEAVVVNSLTEALADCHWAMGVSARLRKVPWPIKMARAAAIEIVDNLQRRPELKIALVFGQEQSGLLNEELMQCHCQIMIPANPLYASLNLAQAVQILSYELRMAILESEKNAPNVPLEPTEAFATVEEIERFYTHLSETLVTIRFLDPAQPGHLMVHLRKLYAKARLTKVELNILRGILTAFKNANSLLYD